MIAALGLAGLAAATALALNAFRSNLVFFYAPSQVRSGQAPPAATFRLGGLVQSGSLRKEADGLTVNFTVTDKAQAVPVTYRGLLPDLFGENRGVVAQGRLRADGTFAAVEILAKHDENYMPPPVAAALQSAAAAQDGDAATPGRAAPAGGAR